MAKYLFFFLFAVPCYLCFYCVFWKAGQKLQINCGNVTMRPCFFVFFNCRYWSFLLILEWNLTATDSRCHSPPSPPQPTSPSPHWLSASDDSRHDLRGQNVLMSFGFLSSRILNLIRQALAARRREDLLSHPIHLFPTNKSVAVVLANAAVTAGWSVARRAGRSSPLQSVWFDLLWFKCTSGLQ